MSHICPWWLAYTFDNPLRSLFHKPRLLFAPYIREGMTVADIGCGLGYFTLGLARMVGDKGRVIAVDVQQEMLDRTSRRAAQAGLAHRVESHLCDENDLRLARELDFALAFWMVHETPHPGHLFDQLSSLLRPSAPLLLTEPKLHVGKKQFQEELAAARKAGFRVNGKVKIAWSRSAELTKDRPASLAPADTSFPVGQGMVLFT